MKLAFVRVRDGKRTVNIVTVLLVGILSAVIGTGLSFLIAALVPASPTTTTLTNLLPLVLPAIVVIPPLVRGLTNSTDDSPAADD